MTEVNTLTIPEPGEAINIRIDREAMLAGEPCWEIDHEPEYYSGIETTGGVLWIRAGEGHGWMEFQGDLSDMVEGGRIATPSNDRLAMLEWNYFPLEEWRRMERTPDLVAAALNRFRTSAHVTSVTAYTRSRAMLVPYLALAGPVRSVTVRPVVNPEGIEPLSTWVEASTKTTELLLG